MTKPISTASPPPTLTTRLAALAKALPSPPTPVARKRDNAGYGLIVADVDAYLVAGPALAVFRQAHD